MSFFQNRRSLNRIARKVSRVSSWLRGISNGSARRLNVASARKRKKKRSKKKNKNPSCQAASIPDILPRCCNGERSGGEPQRCTWWTHNVMPLQLFFFFLSRARYGLRCTFSLVASRCTFTSLELNWKRKCCSSSLLLQKWRPKRGKERHNLAPPTWSVWMDSPDSVFCAFFFSPWMELRQHN